MRNSLLFILIVGAAALLATGCGSVEVGIHNFDAGVQALSDGDLHRAATAFEEALAERPEDARVRYNLASTYHDLWDAGRAAGSQDADRYRDMARAQYEALGGHARAASGLAVLAFDDAESPEEGFEAALTVLKGAVKDTPEGLVLPLWTEACLRLRIGDEDGALDALERGLARSPHHGPSLVTYAGMHLDRPLSPGELSALESRLDAALKVRSFDVSVLVVRARVAAVRARNGSSEDSEAAWREALLRAERVVMTHPTSWRGQMLVADAQEALLNVGAAVRTLWSARGAASDHALRAAREDPIAWRTDIAERLIRLYTLLPEWERNRKP